MTFEPLDPDARIYIAGHGGLVGSAVWRHLDGQGFTTSAGGRRTWTCETARRPSTSSCRRPDVVVVAAAKVGGIMANTTYPVDFLNDNLRIQINVLDAALPRRRPTALPGLLVHLPQARAPADPRGRPADRPPGADQRRLRHREDRRHPARAGVSPAVRPALDLGHADEPLRARRQLRLTAPMCCRP